MKLTPSLPMVRALIPPVTRSSYRSDPQGEERTLVNAFISWESANQNLNLTLYGKNLTNKTGGRLARPLQRCGTSPTMARHGNSVS